MEKNIEHYVLKVKLLDKKLCKTIVEELQHVKWMMHFWSSPERGVSHVNKDQEPEQSSDVTRSHELIIKKIHPKLQDYMIHIKTKWYYNWNGYTNLKWLKYTSTSKMTIHCDHISGFYGGSPYGIPTLSCLCNLNDDFTGGDVVLFQNKNMKMKIGEMIIFPSNFLFPHEIKPIKKGTRYSFVSWVY